MPSEIAINLLQIKFELPGYIGEENGPLCIYQFQQSLEVYSFLNQKTK